MQIRQSALARQVTWPRLHLIRPIHRHLLMGAFSSSKGEVTLETVIFRSNRSPAPTPPDLLYVPAGMARSRFRAMGTTISLLAPAEDLKRGEEMVRALFFDWEQALSRFLPESGLSQLNRMAGSPVIVEELLFCLVKRRAVSFCVVMACQVYWCGKMEAGLLQAHGRGKQWCRNVDKG
jgi:hypothetical protein